MPVNFPEYVQIGAHKYRILFPHRFRDGKEYCGFCDNSLHEIRISDVDGAGNPCPDSRLVQVFFHELLHAIDEVYGGHKIFKDERDVDSVAQGLAQVFVSGELPAMVGGLE